MIREFPRKLKLFVWAGLFFAVGFFALQADLAMAAPINISGTLYSDEGVTEITTGKTLSLAVGTTTVSVQSTTTDSGAGTFTFTIDNGGGLAVDTPFTVWVDNEATTTASVVSKFNSTSADVTGLNLYEDRVIVRQEGSTSTTLADLANYDSTDDSDIRFVASSTRDTLEILSDQELHIWTGDTFVNAFSTFLTGDLHNDGVFDRNDGWVYFKNAGASFIDSFSVAGEETQPAGLAFSSTGSKMFVVGTAGLDVNEYDLSTPFDVSTASFVDSFSVSAQNIESTSLAFSSTGDTMFVLDSNYAEVEEYTLSTDWDVSTASYVDAFDASGQSGYPHGLAFSATGDKMFVADRSGDGIHEYTLSTDWDVSTASYSDSFSVSTQDTDPFGLTFSATGYNMFVVGVSGRDINEYILSTAWDITTASFVESFGVSSQDTAPTGLAFSTTSDKLFVLGDTGDDVNEYSIDFIQSSVVSGDFTGSSTFNNVVVEKTVVIADSASTSNLIVSTNATLTAPTELTIDGVYENNGSFNHNNGTLYFEGLGAYDVSLAEYNSSYSVASQELYPNGIAFSSTGSKMFVVGEDGDDVNEYTLSTNFDPSSASFVDSFSVSGQDITPAGLTFSTAGDTMFVVGTVGNDVSEYTLSTDWDVSTASYVDSFDASAGGSIPYGIAFSTTGDRMILGDINNAEVDTYTLSTPFDVSTASYVNGLDISDQDPYPVGLDFSATGDTLFMVGQLGDDIHEYNLTSPFDISTASFNDSLDLTNTDTNPVGMTFSDTGDAIFVLGWGGSAVYKYELFSEHSGNLIGSSSLNKVVIKKETQQFGANASTTHLTINTGSAFTAPSNLTISGRLTNNGVLANNDGRIYLSGLGDYDVSNASYVDAFSVSGQDSTPHSMAFSATGDKMFVLGAGGDDVNEYTLGTYFDVSTAMFVDSFSIASEETNPRGLAFSATGDKMFMVGLVGDAVNEYSLGTPFDVSTASFSASTSVATEETSPHDLAFSATGDKMFVVGDAGNDVNEYTLSTPFDVTSASFVDSFSVAGEDTFPTALAFSATGDKMFVGGANEDSVHEYTLGTSFDVSTASLVHSFSVAGEETSPTGIAFSATGDKMFVVGDVGDSVHEYEISAEHTGFFTATSTLNDLVIADHRQIFASNASTTDLVIESGGELVAPEQLTVDISYTNNGTFTHNNSTLYLSGPVGYNLSTASFVDGFDVSSQESNPLGLTFSLTGDKMFVVGYSGLDVNEYTLSTNFDASSASFVDSFSVAGQNIEPLNMSFSTDGDKFFVIDADSVEVEEYSMSVNFDVSTASYVDAYGIGGQNGYPHGLAFSPTGDKMFVVDWSGDDVHEYTLSANFDVSSASYVDGFDISAQEVDPYGLTFSPTGDKMFVAGGSGDDINVYTMTSPFDVSTASYFENFSVAVQDTNPVDVDFSATGDRLYVLGNTNTTVFEYSLTANASSSLSGTMTGSSSFNNVVVNDETTIVSNASTSHFTINTNSSLTAPAQLTIDGVYTNNGTFTHNNGTMYLSGLGYFDPSNASFVASTSVESEELGPTGLAFSKTGDKMFVMGATGQDVNEYTLSTNFDVSSASFVDSFSVATEENIPYGLTFSPDGYKMFVVGYGNDNVNEYTLSTNFDVSSASFTASTSVAEEDFPISVAFSATGDKMFVGGGGNINMYTLSTNFDVSTASFSASTSVATEETSPHGIAFSPDGYKMFVVGNSSDNVNEYALEIAFDIATTTFVYSFSVASEDGYPSDIVFSTNGKKMFVMGTNGYAVNEYEIAADHASTLTGNSSLGNVVIADKTQIFSTNATTSDFTIISGATFKAPITTLEITGDYHNDGTFLNNGGDVHMNGPAPYDITEATFVDSFSVSGQDSNTRAITFSSTGDKMFVIGGAGVDINEYTLTTHFDISTASFVDSFSVSAEDASPRGLTFSASGDKLFVTGFANDNVYEYTLSTPFDVSTASYVYTFDVSSQDTDPRGIAFSSTGTKMFVVGEVGNDVNEYTLSVPWDISTAIFVDSFNVLAQDDNPNDIAFSASGYLMFLGGQDGSDVNKYSLTNPWDVSTASYVSNFSVYSQETNPRGIAFSSSGDKLFVAGYITDSVHEYDISNSVSGTLVGTSTFNQVDISGGVVIVNNASTTHFTINSTSTLRASTSITIDGVYTNNGTFTEQGSTLYFEGFGSYDILNASFTDSFDMSAEDNQPRSLTFSATGDKMFTAGATGDKVYEYTLSVAFDVTTASLNASTSVAAQEIGPTGLAFSTNGDKMFVVGSDGDDVNEYTLSTPWDVTTASFVDSFDVSSEAPVPRGVDFSQTGDKMYVVETFYNTVNEYNLSTNFDLSTASFSASTSVETEDTDPMEATFSHTGDKMFMVGGIGIDINEYTLSTPWDVTTASFVDSFDVSGEDSTPTGVAFSNTGGKMFVTGTTYDDVYEYEISATHSGTLTGDSALGNVVIGDKTQIFDTDASTTDLTINPDAVLQTLGHTWDIVGNYTNNGLFTASTSEVIFSGTTQQTATGTMTGSSQFNDLSIYNTSGDGTTTQSVVFGAPVTATGTFTMTASTSAQFLAGATSTFGQVDWLGGDADSPVWLRSSVEDSEWYLDVPGTQLNVQYVNVKDSNASSSAGGEMIAGDSVDSGNNSNWSFIRLTFGSSTISSHDAGQVSNAFDFQNKTNEALFAFKLTPETGTATVTALTLAISGALNVDSSDFSNIRLYRDYDNDAEYDASETQVGGAGVMDLSSGITGTVTFTGDFLSTTSENYVVIADWNVPHKRSVMNINLYTGGLVGIDYDGVIQVFGSVSNAQHSRYSVFKGGGGSNVAIGDPAPPGRSVVTGGTNEGGELIGDNPNFKWPTAHSGAWTNAANAYDKVDGTYATDNAGGVNSFTDHSFVVPGSNTIEGVEVKLEISGTTGAGDIDIELSWDGGTSWTSAKTTPTLTTTDTVVSSGGPSDKWGRVAWAVSDFSNANFVVRLTGNPSSNTVQVDAIQVRIYHQASGGGSGGGGGI